MEGDKCMKCYTIQKLKAWREAEIKGYLTGNEEFLDGEWLSPYYPWMKKQMVKRIKNYNNETLVWLWLDPSNINFVELLDDKYVLLEVEVEDDQILLSNFDAWNFVLNDWNLDETNTISKEESWEYMFDKEKLEKYELDFENCDLQGTMGKIDCKNIKVLKHII